VTYPESLDHMLAAWNEPDPVLVRHHVETAVAPRALAGWTVTISSTATHGRSAAVALRLPGLDVTEVDEHGQVTRVLGFFGPLPDAD
jgi:hypothetical protein